jgi:hypothetical protein
MVTQQLSQLEFLQVLKVTTDNDVSQWAIKTVVYEATQNQTSHSGGCQQTPLQTPSNELRWNTNDCGV